VTQIENFGIVLCVEHCRTDFLFEFSEETNHMWQKKKKKI
jgi:hypothetical protein